MMQRFYKPYGTFLFILGSFIVLCCFDSPPAHTQSEPAPLTQLTNQHTGVVSAAPLGFTELNGQVYFGVWSEKGGLWQTDGTEQGTVLVKDVKLEPYFLQRIEDLLYFVVYDEPHNPALWKSDGTADGTVLVKSDLSLESTLVSMGGEIYFIAEESLHGRELWKSDGTPEGTLLVADLTLGPEGTNINIIVAGSDRVYFTGDQGSRELWQSDGTPAGTHAVAGAPDEPRELVMLQDVLYFAGVNEQYGDELWRYGAGDTAASLVADIYEGVGSSYIRNMVAMGDRLFFNARDNTRGSELWQSDGSAAGTQIVKDLTPEWFAGGAGPDEITVVNDLLFFTANTPEIGKELWKSDGTAAGTVLVKDIVPGPDGSEMYFLTPSMDRLLYFILRNDQARNELWQSDGTAAGTVRLFEPAEEQILYGYFAPIDGAVYFAADHEADGAGLWVSDGTSAGTRFIADLDPNHIGSDLDSFTRVNKRLYYTAPQNFGSADVFSELWMRDGRDAEVVLVDDKLNIEYVQSLGNELLVVGADETGFGLWKHDGTTGPLELVWRNQADWYGPYNFAELDHQFYFTVSRDAGGELPLLDIWRTDGTAAGTIKLNQEEAEFAGWAPSAIYAGSVIFANGNELWVTNGTSNDVNHFIPAGIGGGITWFANTSHALYFFARDNTAQMQRTTLAELWQVWRTDGTANGTHQLQSNPSLPYINDITVAGNSFYFTTHNPDLSRDLWCGRDGSPELVNVVHIPSPANRELFYLSHFQGVGDRLFFTMNDNVHGRELWTSDCTLAGTKLVKDIAPPTFDNWYILGPDNSDHWSFQGPIFEFDGQLFFGAYDGVYGKELWRSDGTAEGTVMVKDIYPGILSSSPDSFMRKGNLLFFTAIDGVHGRELWQSDGTESGTWLVTDLYAGAASARPSPQLIFDSTIYFVGDNGLDGRQLFALFDPGIPLDLPIGEEPGEWHQLYMPLVKR